MITNANQPYDAGNYYREADDLVGLSTDTKPINLGNGSTIYEMDTGDKYMFDADGATWYKIFEAPSASSSDDAEEEEQIEL